MDELKPETDAGRADELRRLAQIRKEVLPTEKELRAERQAGKAFFMRERGWRFDQNRSLWRDWLTGKLFEFEKAYATELRRKA